jgi:glutathione S-transferase
MLTVHHLETSRSQRILWLLEELGVPTNCAATSAIPGPAWRHRSSSVHPLGKSPVITDAGIVVAESGAIIESG